MSHCQITPNKKSLFPIEMNLFLKSQMLFVLPETATNSFNSSHCKTISNNHSSGLVGINP